MTGPVAGRRTKQKKRRQGLMEEEVEAHAGPGEEGGDFEGEEEFGGG